MNLLKQLAKKPFVLILLVVLLSLTVRIIYINQLKGNPFFDHPIVDSHEYHQMALKIAQGEAPRDDAFYQPPLYSYFLGYLYKFLGTDFFWIRLLQMMLGVINILLTMLLAKRIFNLNIALISGITLAFCGSMLFFEGELLAPVVIIFLNLLLMLASLSFLDSPTWWRASICGLLLGLSAITMAIILPFAMVAVAAGFYYFKLQKDSQTSKQALVFALSFVLSIMAIILPVTLYNLNQSDDFVLISANGGINFYLGTGRDFEKKVAIRPGYQWNELMKEPLNAGFKKPSEQSNYYFKQSLSSIGKDPLSFLWGTLKKLYLFINGNEIMRNQELYPFRNYSPLLSVLLWKKGVAFPFGLLFPLAVVGAMLAIKRKIKNNLLLLLFCLSHILVLIFFFISARYRMNILPLLVIYAVYGASVLIHFLRRKDFSKTIVPGILLLLMLIISNWGVGSMPQMFNADAYFNLGFFHMERGHWDKAKEYYGKALQQDPHFPDANGNLGIILRDIDEDYKGAAECFQRVLVNYPKDIKANFQLGLAHYNLGNLVKAKEQFENVLKLDESNKDARYNLSIINGKLNSDLN
jgi:tetratricopeptide (TPR) repeat protein